MKKEKLFEKDSPTTASGQLNNIILFNDDYHTFDFVIDALQRICKHRPEQAVQCTYIVHYNGKCEVKKGDFDTLKPMQEELVNIGLTAEIS